MVKPLHRKLWRDIGRHRMQFIAVTITMFLGVTVFGATYDSFQNLQASYRSTATEFHFANLTVVGGDVEAIAAVAGQTSAVESAITRTSADVPFRVHETKLLGRAVGLPAAAQPEVNQLDVLSGSYLTPAHPDGILVEKHMADHFDLSPGDSFEILSGATWHKVTVEGVVASPEYIWPARDRQKPITTPDNFGVVFTSEELARELAGGGPNEAIIYYAHGEEDGDATQALTAEARSRDATSVYTREEQASNAALSEDLKGFEEMAVFFPIMFLTAAALAAYVMISRLVHAQRPHIGVFLANGFTRGQVLRHYLAYGLLPGLIGSVPGAVVGVLLARSITRLYTSLLSIPITLIQFYPATLLGAFAFGLVASLLAALAPALVASRVLPAEAMRGETPARRGRQSLFERLIPPVRGVPVAWRMALRGVGRNPRRTTYTIIGVVLSLMLVLVSWGMIDTIRYLMDRQFVEIQREDATVYFAGPATTEDVGALLAIEGVAEAEPALVLPVSLEAGGRHYETALMVLEDDSEMHRLMSTTDGWIDLPDQGIVLGKATRELLDIDIGDPVNITLPTGISVAEPVSAFVDEPLGTMAYVARSRAETLTGTDLPATSALIAYADGVDAKALRNTITELPRVAAFEDAKVLYDVMQSFMILFYAFVGVMLLFGGAMAFALIFNAMSANIAERTREVATLLAMGTDRRSISRYITTENLLVAAMGIPIGLVVGHYAAKAAMASFGSDLFSFDLHIQPMTYVWASLAILVVALISQWPGLRAIRTLSIPKIIKERAA
ncbi:MAG: FtsX-like permease family protein [Acidobacteria bacterium]|nr:FtsX-like permease family protein [Acidobacteriota bacterium]